MDILIKSFNRIYYLDRCLFSIYNCLQGFEGNIKILDDGTPSKYLEKIKLKYPKITIYKSSYYDEKSQLLECKNYNLPIKIPSNFWYETAKESSNYFMLLEDDMWFKETINASELIKVCENERIILLKLFWVSNTNVIGKQLLKKNKNILVYKPKIPYKSNLLFQLIFMKYNFIWRKILKYFGVYSLKKELSYYSIYATAGAVFKKDYFLDIWKHADSILDEKKQLQRALKFYKSGLYNYARTDKEFLQTSFLSSSFSKRNFKDFSIHDFNTTLNEFWLNNSNFFLSDLNNDLDVISLKKILKKEKSKDYILQWESWVEDFKNNYKKMGCNI